MPNARPASKPDTRDTAHYIELMARELRALAGQADLGVVAYLLGMVEDEAAATARRLEEKAQASP